MSKREIARAAEREGVREGTRRSVQERGSERE